MSRRPVYESPIPDFLDSENEEQAREAIGAASQEELDALKEAFDNSDIGEIGDLVTQINSKVSQTEFDAYKSSTDSAIGEISSDLNTKVEQSEFNAYKASNDSSVGTLQTQVASKVAQTEFNAYKIETDSDINSINGNIAGLTNVYTELAANTYPLLLPQKIMGNPNLGANGRPSPIDLDDGGLIISGGKIQVGDTYGKVIFIDAARTDNKVGKGTASSPYNGSTPNRIDIIMKELYDAKTPANVYFLPHPSIYINPVRIHDVYPVVPSVFHPWYLYNGLRIHGFGKGRTVFKPATVVYPGGHTAQRSQCIFRSSYKPEDSEFMFHGGIYDCTMDGGVTNTAILPGPEVAYKMAFGIVGGEVTIDGVEMLRFGGRGQEMFPFILVNGQSSVDGSIVYIPARPCFYQIRNCSSDYMYHAGEGIGGLINGPVGGTANQMAILSNNRFLDMYITWAQFNNFTARDNFLRNVAGSAIGNNANFNCDTGINRGIKIIDNVLVGAIGNGNAFGSVTLGSRLGRVGGVQTMICSDILIRGNTFKPHPNAQNVYNPGVLLSGNCYNWNISDNFYEIPSSYVYKYGFVSAKGTGNATPPVGAGAGSGFGASWLTPEDANSDGIMLNNKLIEWGSADHGKTPLGMDNKLMSALT